MRAELDEQPFHEPATSSTASDYIGIHSDIDSFMQSTYARCFDSQVRHSRLDRRTGEYAV